MGITVVIPARDAAAMLGAQLDALRGQGADVTVVDNASTDGTGQVARAHGARVLRCETVGINAARNVGVRATDADKILFCDADDVVNPGWVEAMSAGLDDYDIVGGKLDLGTLNEPFVARLQEHVEQTLPIGACLGIRRTTWEAAGGFDEDFVIGYDDIDFIERAEALGLTVGWTDAVVSYRLRGDVRSYARWAARNRIAGAQLRAKRRIPQPWKAQVWRAGYRVLVLASVWRLRTRAGRWEYLSDAYTARLAPGAWRRYRVVP